MVALGRQEVRVACPEVHHHVRKSLLELLIRAELLEQQAASLATRLVPQDRHGEAASVATAVCVHRQQRPATLAELQIEAGCDRDSIIHHRLAA